MSGWRGDTYLGRSGAAQTYDEARDRARALKVRNWRHYLDLAAKHNLPTQPQTLWPDEWESGGRYADFLGTLTGQLDDLNMVSAAEVRRLLGIGHATWKLLSDDLLPDGAMGHKLYYYPERVREHVSANMGRLKKCDAIANLLAALENL